MFNIAGPEDAAKNAERFERIWRAERKRCEETGQKPSLNRAVWQFGRTRFLVCLFLVALSMLFQFIGPVRFI